MSYWGAIIEGAVDLYNGQQANHAAGAQGDAAQQGLDFTKSVYGDAQGNFAPYLQQGQQGVDALGRLNGGDYSGFFNSPDYQAALKGGVDMLDHSAAANYRLGSGGYQVDLQNAGQQNAAGFLNQYRNALQYMATSGQNAAGTLGGIGSQTSQQVNGAYGAIGDAAASRYGANAGTATALGGLANNWLQGRNAQTNSSYANYGGGGSSGQYGLPAPVSSYQNTNWGNP